MTVSLFPNLLCLLLFKQGSELFPLITAHDSVPQNAINPQIMGALLSPV